MAAEIASGITVQIPFRPRIKALEERVPDISHLRVIGSKAWVCIPKEIRGHIWTVPCGAGPVGVGVLCESVDGGYTGLNHVCG
jgi:hypothetical protein